MIGSKQIQPRPALVSSGASDVVAQFQQCRRALPVSYWMEPWAIFEEGAALSICYGIANIGTFTAEIYLGTDADPSFIVTEADTTGVGLESGKTGTTPDPVLTVRCQITASSADLEGLFIKLE